MHRLTRTNTALLIIDVQGRLSDAMPRDPFARVLNRTVAAIEGAKALGWPIIITEQYPKGLGPTLREVSSRVPVFAPIEKTDFSAYLPPVIEQLTGRPNVLICGMETHVCVFQTVRAMAQAGLSPYVAADAVLSRNALDRDIGLELCRASGAVVTTVETALFDALERAGGPQFKAVSTAVK